MNTTIDKTAAPPRIPVRLWKIAAITGAGAFVAMLDSTVANLALDAIRRDFALSLSSVQWVSVAYLIALAVSLPVAGWMGSRYGYGRLWAKSLAAFVAMSALCALAPGIATLTLARLLQGLAAGLMIPAGQAAIASAADNRQLGRLMGVVGLVVALGPAVGPGIGGVLIDIGSWRWLFWINVPIGFVALWAARNVVPPGETANARDLDFPGLVLIGSGLPVLLYGATQIATAQSDKVSVSAITGGAILVIAFLVRSARSGQPLIDVSLLKKKQFAAATATSALTGASMYGGLLLLPLYLQDVLGFDSTNAGLMLLVMGLGSALTLPVAGTLTDRLGAGAVSLAGCGLLLLSTAVFLQASILTFVVVAIALLVRGVGLAAGQMPAMTAAYGQVGKNELGDAATLVNIAQRVGGALGAIAVVAALQRSAGPGAPGQQTLYEWGFIVLVIISAFSVVSAVFLLPPKR